LVFFLSLSLSLCSHDCEVTLSCSIRAEECVRWVCTTLHISINENDILGIAGAFHDGVYFCQLLNAFFPNTILDIHTADLVPQKCNENLVAFMTGCRLKLGLTGAQLFDPQDIIQANGKAALQVFPRSFSFFFF